MASLKSTIITNQGLALLTKVGAGLTTLSFTTVRNSDTAYSDAETPALTAISPIKHVVPINWVSRPDDTTVKVNASIINTALTSGYYVETIGLYATDPDLGEILFSVTRAQVGTADWMPANDGVTSTVILINLLTTISASSTVNVSTELASYATQDDIKVLTDNLADMAGYIGYTDSDIYGVEVDYTTGTFTRLAGAVGKTAGADFDNIPMYKRRRCNLANTGVVNAYFGDAGYVETGANGQVMVEQPKFYYKVVPLVLERNDAQEIASVKFDTGAAASGNITITLNGTAFNVAVASGDTIQAIAAKVSAAIFTGWTTQLTGSSVVTFTKVVAGKTTGATFSGGTTGVTATGTRVQIGYIGKGFKTRKVRYYISATQKAGFKLHPAFIKNNIQKDKIFLSAYEGCAFSTTSSSYLLNDEQTVVFNDDRLCSIAGAKPLSGLTQSATRANCTLAANQRGTGWSQQYAATVAATQLLFLIEYASLNSQTAIGKGVTGKASGTGNESVITGATSNLGNASGMATGTNGLVSITYRGEENVWGNIWKYVEGINIYGDANNGIHDVYIADNGFVESSKTSPYVDVGLTIPTKSGYISALAYSEIGDWLFMPAELLGTDQSPVGDYYYQNIITGTYKVVAIGGVWWGGLNGGILTNNVANAPTYFNRANGCRIVYVPPIY